MNKTVIKNSDVILLETEGFIKLERRDTVAINGVYYTVFDNTLISDGDGNITMKVSVFKMMTMEELREIEKNKPVKAPFYKQWLKRLKTTLRLTLIVIFTTLFLTSHSQTKYDTSLYKQVSVVDIELSQKVGHWVSVKSTDSGEVRFVPLLMLDRFTWDHYKHKNCFLMAKDQWELLSKNKN